MALRASILIAITVAITISSGHAYYTIPGRLKHITATPNYIWGVNRHDLIYVCRVPCRGGWRQIPGRLMQVDADDHEVWGVNSAHHIYKRPVDGSGHWTHVGGLLTHVTASGNGYLWGVNRYRHIYKCAKPCRGAWRHVPGGLRQIDGGQARVYGVNVVNDIWTRLVDGARYWRRIHGKLRHITGSGTDEVFGTIHGHVYRCRKPCRGIPSQRWRRMSGWPYPMKQVDATIQAVYGVMWDGRIIQVNLGRRP